MADIKLDLKILSIQKVINFQKGVVPTVGKLSSNTIFSEHIKGNNVVALQITGDGEQIIKVGGNQYETIETWKVRDANSPDINRILPDSQCSIVKYQPLFMVFYSTEYEGERLLIPMKDYFNNDLDNHMKKGIGESETTVMEKIIRLTQKVHGLIKHSPVVT